ncbi:MAG: hypothetical protein RBS73_18120 [Prolixibacteraceae bacterium]|jgi:hypothetical protein|nr:hypothetical protein [Prolixibacteraceae bacterium]
MKKLMFLAFIAMVLTVFNACQNDGLESGLQFTVEKKVLTTEEQILKEKLVESSEIVMEIISEKTVLTEILDYFKDKNHRRLYFKDIFEKESDLKSFSTSSSIFKSRFLECYHKKNKLKSTEQDLINYLIDNGVNIYIPYSFDNFPIKKQNEPTITSDPIDNEEENIGFKIFEDGQKEEVLVNDEYNLENPVIVLMPEEENLQFYQNLKSATSGISTVSLGEIYCKYMAESYFHGDLEVVVLRGTAVGYDASKDVLVGSFLNMTPIQVTRDDVREAQKGYRKGWVPVYIPWDTNWDTNLLEQCIAAYEDDAEGTVTITGSTKTGGGFEISGVKLTNEYSAGFSRVVTTSNQIFGLQQWDRGWFYATQTYMNEYDKTYFKDDWKWNGWPIRKLSNEFWITMTNSEY